MNPNPRRSRRLQQRQARARRWPVLNLVPLMDVFTILVFFLLANSSSNEVLSTPKHIKLPDSVVESKPRETVVIMVGPETVMVQGEAVANTPEVMAAKDENIPEITQKLGLLEQNIIGINSQTVINSKEVTILADKTIPFNVLKKIMTTCTGSGYGRISLAVIQKAAET